MNLQFLLSGKRRMTKDKSKALFPACGMGLYRTIKKESTLRKGALCSSQAFPGALMLYSFFTWAFQGAGASSGIILESQGIATCSATRLFIGSSKGISKRELSFHIAEACGLTLKCHLLYDYFLFTFGCGFNLDVVYLRYSFTIRSQHSR